MTDNVGVLKLCASFSGERGSTGIAPLAFCGIMEGLRDLTLAHKTIE